MNENKADIDWLRQLYVGPQFYQADQRIWLFQRPLLWSGVETKQRTTKQENHKTAKNNMEDNETAINKIATITKQRTLQNSQHNKTAIITK